jgi:hypothetical protein
LALYDRLLGRDDAGSPVAARIPIHLFSALMGEVARGKVTGAQALQAITDATGTALDAAGQTDAQTLLATISGSSTAKLLRAKEIDDVLISAENDVVYPTPSLVKTRLGV